MEGGKHHPVTGRTMLTVNAWISWGRVISADSVIRKTCITLYQTQYLACSHDESGRKALCNLCRLLLQTRVLTFNYAPLDDRNFGPIRHASFSRLSPIDAVKFNYSCVIVSCHVLNILISGKFIMPYLVKFISCNVHANGPHLNNNRRTKVLSFTMCVN